jgi:hypothetical protein
MCQVKVKDIYKHVAQPLLQGVPVQQILAIYGN